MPIKSYEVDEGSLVLGEVASTMDMTAQVTEVAVDFSEEVGDSKRTLSGETLSGAATYPATLSGTVIQDLSDAGLIEWTWAHKGEVVPFQLSPANVTERVVTGMVRVGPLKLGGPVGENGPTSDFEWAVIGDPVLGSDL